MTGLTQLGNRNVSSTAQEDYEAARAMGSDILSVRQLRAMGTEAVLARTPAGVDYYLSIDIDGFDPSIAPGTGTPSHGGFLLPRGIGDARRAGSARPGRRHRPRGEVAPDQDRTGTTAILAAQLLLDLIGRIFRPP